MLFVFPLKKLVFFLLVFTALVLCTVRCTPILLLITATDWQLSRVHANPLLSRVNAILHTIYVCICLEQGCACVRAYQTYLRTTVSHFRSVHNQIFYASKKKKIDFLFLQFVVNFQHMKYVYIIFVLVKICICVVWNCFTVRYVFAMFGTYMEFNYAPFAKLMPKYLRGVYCVLRKDDCRVTKENICLFY